MSELIETKWIAPDRNGRDKRWPIKMELKEGIFNVVESAFELKDDIKSMQGQKCHFVQGNFSHWSFSDTPRNRFQMEWLEGGNPYEWFERPVVEHDYPKFGSDAFGYFDLMPQQKLMTDLLLSNRYCIWAAEMGLGKTLSAIAAMMLSGKKGFWWIGPKSSLYGIKQEFKDWGLPEGTVTEMMTYDALVQRMRTWKAGTPAPIGVIFDEAHALKSPTSHRSHGAMGLANAIRKEHGMEGLVCLMTGTPSPKKPSEWWSLAEVAWPGFLREGDIKIFEKRLTFTRLREYGGQIVNKPIGWRNDENKCDVCGQYFEDGNHYLPDGNYQLPDEDDIKPHEFVKSVNEVELIAERLEGLALFLWKKDWLDLDEKVYRRVKLPPSKSLLRVAKAIAKSSTNALTSTGDLRKLSDGFQYREEEDGVKPCPVCEDGTITEWHHPNDPGASLTDVDLLDPDFVAELKERTVDCYTCKGTQQVKNYKRVTKQVPCPKEDAVVDLLEEQSAQGRIVFFAGFTGSLDRIVDICHREGWSTMRIDGRGYDIRELEGHPGRNAKAQTRRIKLDNPLDYWKNPENRKVAIVAHPKSGGASLTLCEQEERPGANLACFYSNDYTPATRAQAEDRIHRTGMLGGATIVDLLHLPSDYRALTILLENRQLEKLSMGQQEEIVNAVLEELEMES